MARRRSPHGLGWRAVAAAAPSPWRAPSSGCGGATSRSCVPGAVGLGGHRRGGAEQVQRFLLISKQNVVPAEGLAGAFARRLAAALHQRVVGERLVDPVAQAVGIAEEDRGLAGGPAVIGIVMRD